MNPPPQATALHTAIAERFWDAICARAPLERLAREHPIELAYALALVSTGDALSIMPKWVMMRYLKVQNVLHQLRGAHCLEGCAYCARNLDPHAGLKRWFGYDAFRSYGGEPLQENAVRAALDGKSMLVLFPTGGGKSITFQVPALIAGEVERGLTVVLSPLQSLMKDQVDNLLEAGVTRAVAISGLLDPIERAKAIEQVADGSAATASPPYPSTGAWTRVTKPPTRTAS